MPMETADLLELRPPPDDGAIATALAELEAKLSSWSSSAHAIHENLGRRTARSAEIESALTQQQQQLDRQLTEFNRQREELGRQRDDFVARQTAVMRAPEHSAPETASVAPPPAPEKPIKKRPRGPEAADESHESPSGQKQAGRGETAHVKSARSARTDRDEPVVTDGAEMATTPEPAADDRGNDESLLESLDSAMANMIRQRHRDSGGRRSIKDLIAEHEKEMDEAEALLDSLPGEVAADIRVQFRFYNGRKTIKQLIEEYKAEPGSDKHSWWKRVKG